MTRSLLRLGSVLAGLAFGAWMWGRTAPEPRPPPPPVGLASYSDFTVQTEQGPLALSDLRGKAVVLYFGYTTCPDICPTTLATMKRGFEQLDPRDRARTELLFVSVDPDRDDPDRLAQYVEYFDPGFRAGTVPENRLEPILKDWGVFVRKVARGDSALDYLVDHTTQAFLVGPSGELMQVIHHGTGPGEVREAIEAALAGK